ncbi:MAG: fibronectin type III domain-containing protein [Bacteroidales bacterium]|nr:fibronectin type III domain-containing protein [Bacteroidales bacterium]
MRNILKLMAALAIVGGLVACNRHEEPGEKSSKGGEEFSSATNLSAELWGSLFNMLGSGEITEYGFLVSGNDPFDNAEAIAYAADVEDVRIFNNDISFSCRITGLVPDTRYYYKLYYVMDDEMIVEETVYDFKTKNYLMFTCLDGTVELEFAGVKDRKDWLISVDGEILTEYEGQKITLTKGKTVQFVNKDLHDAKMELSNYGGLKNFKATGDGRLSVSGDLTSLVSRENYYSADFKIPDHTFYALFRGCTALVDAGELIFPEVAEVGRECYYDMFNGCTNLVRAPGRIPGKTVGVDGCYRMFYDCTSLVSAPELPATTLAESCYNEMFYNCESLKTAPDLPATTVPEHGYKEMFYKCKSLEKAPKIAGTSFGEYSCFSMFGYCENLTVAPEFHEATLSRYCFYQMFEWCSKLASTPYLPSKYLADHCYHSMFYGCTGLEYARKIDATRMAEGSCSYMFAFCENLTSTPELPAMIMAKECYSRMFMQCRNLTSASSLPATNLAPSCYLDMFTSCTSLKTAPDLIATKTVEDCYKSMFMHCDSLNYIKIYATSDPTIGACFTDMAKGVATFGDLYVKNSEILTLVINNAGRSVQNNWHHNYF